jgi:hypothetical protein
MMGGERYAGNSGSGGRGTRNGTRGTVNDERWAGTGGVRWGTTGDDGNDVERWGLPGVGAAQWTLDWRAVRQWIAGLAGNDLALDWRAANAGRRTAGGGRTGGRGDGAAPAVRAGMGRP